MGLTECSGSEVKATVRGFWVRVMHTCEDVGIGRSTETQYETGAGAKM